MKKQKETQVFVNSQNPVESIVFAERGILQRGCRSIACHTSTIAVYHWSQGSTQKAEAIVHRKELERLFDVPHGSGETTGQDKAEGMNLQ